MFDAFDWSPLFYDLMYTTIIIRYGWTEHYYTQKKNVVLAVLQNVMLICWNLQRYMDWAGNKLEKPKK